MKAAATAERDISAAASLGLTLLALHVLIASKRLGEDESAIAFVGAGCKRGVGSEDTCT